LTITCLKRPNSRGEIITVPVLIPAKKYSSNNRDGDDNE